MDIDLIVNTWTNKMFEDSCEEKTTKHTLNMTHDNISDAVWFLMEQLYDTKHAIDPNGIKDTFRYLCAELMIDDDVLDENLCVVHESRIKKDKGSAFERISNQVQYSDAVRKSNI